jgi:hypothetical protein
MTIIISVLDLQLRLEIGALSILEVERVGWASVLAGSRGAFLDVPYFALHHFSQAVWKDVPDDSSSEGFGALRESSCDGTSSPPITLRKESSSILLCAFFI